MLDWTQERLALEARVSRPRVSNIENGRVRPYEGELARIAEALMFRGKPAELLLEEVSD